MPLPNFRTGAAERRLLLCLPIYSLSIYLVDGLQTVPLSEPIPNLRRGLCTALFLRAGKQ